MIRRKISLDTGFLVVAGNREVKRFLNMNETAATELVKIACVLIADDYPIGLPDKRRQSIDILRTAIAEKKIYNPRYNEAKRLLSSQLEDLHRNLKVEAFSIAYALGALPYQFNHLPIAVKNLEVVVRSERPPLDILPTLPSSRIEGITGNWSAVREDLIRYSEALKSWLPVKELLDEAKKYIIKGREPSGIPSSRYVPGIPKTEIVAFVRKELETLVAPLVPKLVETRTTELVKQVEGIAEKMPDVMKAHPEWQFLPSQAVRSIVGEGSASRMFLSVWKEGVMNPDYQKVIHRLVETDVKAMSESFVVKNTGKLAPIVSHKGDLKGAKVLHGGLEGFGFWGEIQFDFDDGAGFVVRNKMVVKWSQGTGSFAQFPTTFHRVKFSDGSVKAMQSEEQMNEEWAVGKVHI